MAILLHIDTATQVCSVSLSKDGAIIGIEESMEEKVHASLLTVFIDRLFKKTSLRPEDLDAIAVSKGPGSYTGLRIGVSVAKGMCYGGNIPFIAINTLKSMANGLIQGYPSEILQGPLLCPMIDARRSEVFTALYGTNLQEILPTTAEIIDETSYAGYLDKNRVLFFGSGSEKCKSLIRNNNAIFIDQFTHSSASMASLAEICYAEKKFENVAYFEPFYLKDFITTTPKTKIM